MKILDLVLTFHWYDLTKSGVKTIEYREMKDIWTKRIWNKREELTHVKFRRGYTTRGLTRRIEKIDIGPCPIEGWEGDFYRIHFNTRDAR